MLAIRTSALRLCNRATRSARPISLLSAPCLGPPASTLTVARAREQASTTPTTSLPSWNATSRHLVAGETAGSSPLRPRRQDCCSRITRSRRRSERPCTRRLGRCSSFVRPASAAVCLGTGPHFPIVAAAGLRLVAAGLDRCLGEPAGSLRARSSVAPEATIVFECLSERGAAADLSDYRLSDRPAGRARGYAAWANWFLGQALAASSRVRILSRLRAGRARSKSSRAPSNGTAGRLPAAAPAARPRTGRRQTPGSQDDLQAARQARRCAARRSRRTHRTPARRHGKTPARRERLNAPAPARR